ncbi:MAG: ribonuclease G [Pseudomonadota bacterium]
MSEEVLINVTPRETRVAVLENGVLQEIYIERASKRGLVGNIYKGKVVRVLPGMQAAFVEIGLERAAFLHESDIVESGHELKGQIKEGITRLLHEGQEVVVQVIKDPLGTKGARLTTQLSFAARFLVLMPGIKHVGVSQKITDEAERERLRGLVRAVVGEEPENGYIVRTVTEGVGQAAIEEDVRYLERLWQSIQERIATERAPCIVHEDLSLAMRAMRDLVGPDVEKVRIDSREGFRKAVKFAEKFIPEVAAKIEHYPGERPIFDLYGVEDEIQKALEKKVQLKSGGYLVIDQTESMTTIDVNTGAFVGHRNLEETIFKTNLEAAQAIARQLRLRNLGGIIILDFIDMEDPEHRRQVLQSLERALAKDHARTHICDVSSLGLVEMTRKRTRESLEHILCESCPVCQGRGSLKTPETVCYEIFRELIREARQYEAQQFLVLASSEVVDRMLEDESSSVAELQEFIGKPVKFQVESLYTQEQFDVVPL